MAQQTKKNARRTCGQFVNVRIVDCCRRPARDEMLAVAVMRLDRYRGLRPVCTWCIRTQPVKVLQCRRHVITPAQTTNESGGCIPNSLQRGDGRLRESGQNCFAVIKSARTNAEARLAVTPGPSRRRTCFRRSSWKNRF
jgi:hypothetical protein